MNIIECEALKNHPCFIVGIAWQSYTKISLLGMKSATKDYKYHCERIAAIPSLCHCERSVAISFREIIARNKVMHRFDPHVTVKGVEFLHFVRNRFGHLGFNG